MECKTGHSTFKNKEHILGRRSNHGSEKQEEVLSKTASLYDPCGFVSPLLLPAKSLLQEICDRKIKWDANLPEELKERWNSIARNLRAATQIEIPRYIGLSTGSEHISYDVHCFTDASKEAYCTVAYIMSYTADEAKVSLLMSKTRVTSSDDKKNLNMPRLELLGFLIGSRLMSYITNVIGVPVNNKYLWTDSRIVLAWTKSNKLLSPFVTRRINEIKQNKDLEMCYINTELNPADIATRPESWHQRQSLWFSGPPFLTQDKSLWPANMQLNDQEAICLAGEGLHQEGTDFTIDQTIP